MERQSTTFILMKIIRDLNHNTNIDVSKIVINFPLKNSIRLQEETSQIIYYFFRRHVNNNVVLLMNVFSDQQTILIVALNRLQQI